MFFSITGIASFAQKDVGTKTYSFKNTLEDTIHDYNKYQLNLQQELSYLQANLSAALTQHDEKKIADCQGSLANFYLGINEASQALINFNKSLLIYNKLKDTVGMSMTLMRIGDCYGKLHNVSKATECFDQSLILNEKAGSEDNVTFIYNTIGLMYLENNDFENALINLKRSLAVSRNWTHHTLERHLMSDIGNIYRQKGDIDSALHYHHLALKLADSSGSKSQLDLVYGDFAKDYVSQKKFSKAKECNNRYIEMLKNLKPDKRIQDAELLAAQIDSALGNFKDGYAHYGQYIILSDKFKSEEVRQAIVKEKINDQITIDKIDQAKKDAIAQAEIAKQKIIRNSIIGGTGSIALISFLGFLNFRNKRKREKAELSQQVSSTEMKALRSQMNPHFIFNALQSIQAFLLSHRSDEASTYLLKFSKLIRAVLENSQHNEVPVKDDVQALELYIQLESIRLTHPFTYAFYIDESVDTENDTIPPLILQPFVENAIWHGLQYKPEPGHINICISKKNNSLHAIVEDNGIGRDMSKQVAQPMLLKKESLGMKLTEERLQVLNEVKKTKAKFTITDLFTKNNEPAGTKVELSLPLSA